VNKYSHYLTTGLASMIRNMDFNLFSLKTDPESYIKTVTLFAYKVDGFAQAYKEWCRNFRHRKDLYWMYEVEPEFDEYKYLGKSIIKELEFMWLYCQRRKKPKNAKGFQYVILEYIDNRKQNYDILKEYLHWLKDGHTEEILFQDHINFQINEDHSQRFLETIAGWIEQAIEYCDEKRKETKFWVETGNIIPWTPFQNKKPAIQDVNRPELNKLIAANVLDIHLILNTASKQEKNIEKLIGKK
jgi:predicted CopG family antitoxin